MKKKLLVLLMVASLAIFAMSIFTSAAVTGVKDGTTWTLSGSGDIAAGVKVPAGITHVIIEEGVTSIPANFAYKHATIESVSIASTVTSLGNNAFRLCPNLTTVTFADNSKLASVGNLCFNASPNLTSVSFGNSLKTIGKEAFRACTSLASVNLGNSLESMGEGVFRECRKLTSINIEGTITTIPAYTFYQCFGLKTATVGDAVTTIGASAFRGSALASFEFPANLKTIGNYAFNMTAITEANLPNTVTSLGDFCFYKCSALKSVTLSNKLTEIPRYCFSVSGLTSVEIPNSVTTINNYAFKGCLALATVDLGDNLAFLGSYAFQDSGVTSVVIPGSDCGAGSFYNCKALKSVVFEEGTEKIGQKMFYNCSALTKADIPSTVKYINDYAFYGCTSLSDVALPASLTQLKIGSFHSTAVTSINVPAGVKNIGVQAFYNCMKLTEVTFNEGLETVGKEAFRKAKLTTVTIPVGCTSLGEGAFRDNPFNEVYVPATVTSFGDKYVFRTTGANALLHTEAGDNAVRAWVAAGANRVTLGEDYVPGGHECEFGDWVLTTAPTANATGLLTKSCTCEATETYVLPALNDVDYTYSVVAAPTCGAAGSAKYAITVDGQSFEFAVEIAATGAHVHGMWTATVPATPFADGVESASCVCGDTITRPVAYVGQAVALDVKVNGTTATATLKLIGAPDLSALGFTIAYSDELTLTAATTTLTGNTADPSIANPVKFVWVNGLENVDVNGDILTLTFTVASGANITADDFTVTYDADDVCSVEDEVVINVALDVFVNVQ